MENSVQECPIDSHILQTLFDPSVPDNPVLWAVFKGHHAGKAFVDDVQHPSQCVIRTNTTLTFASRQITQSFLNKAIAQFRKIGRVWLVGLPSEITQLLASEADSVIQRLEFLDCNSQSHILANLREHLPDGCKIRPIDRQLLDRCEWRSDMEFFCGSVDNFLVNGIGLCMMRGDEIIVEAYASSLGKTHAEIGAITRERHRGHGYAPIACAYLIQMCDQRGYEAYWSCDTDNEASTRVAQKLGFLRKKAYQILEYSSLS